MPTDQRISAVRHWLTTPMPTRQRDLLSHLLKAYDRRGRELEKLKKRKVKRVSDERIAEIECHVRHCRLCGVETTSADIIEELLAELTRLRTREYREPTIEDVGSPVWVNTTGDTDIYVPKIKSNIGGCTSRIVLCPLEIEGTYEEINGRLICPVEQKPLASNEGE